MADIIVKIQDGLGFSDSSGNPNNTINISDVINADSDFENSRQLQKKFDEDIYLRLFNRLVSDIEVSINEKFNISIEGNINNETSRPGEDDIVFVTTGNEFLKDCTYFVSDDIVIDTSIDSDVDINIFSPVDSNEYVFGEKIYFSALVTDNGVEVNPNDIRWISSIDGNFKSGNLFTYSALSIGNHRIVIKVGEHKDFKITNIVIKDNQIPNRPDGLTED